MIRREDFSGWQLSAFFYWTAAVIDTQNLELHNRWKLARRDNVLNHHCATVIAYFQVWIWASLVVNLNHWHSQRGEYYN